ncbi:MAG: divalent-cation tolerance protein CutA [Actinobacteria bacterium]|nr:divalent-cation tolerance protein CutA [Actinomycetota bacterium]
MVNEFVQIITAASERSDAEKIAKVLLGKRLAACVQIIGPITSNYWWRGNIETDEEWLCFIKSNKSNYEDVEKAVKEIHPYEIPEIIAMPIVAGLPDYLAWLKGELRK